MSELELPTLGARAVLDLRGQSRLLGSLWRNQPAVLIWLRHFACLFCKEQASEMRTHKVEIEELGGKLAFVGSGSTAQAQDFRKHYVPGCAVFTDPSSYTYRTIGAKESMGSTVAGFALHGMRAMRQGYFQTSIHRRPFQQGGVLVAVPGDTIAFAHVSKVAGDHPPVEEVIAGLRRGVALAGGPDSGVEPEQAPAPDSMSRPWPVYQRPAFQWNPPPAPDPS